MKIEPFALERWMTTYEVAATHDIAESGILPLSTNDLLGFLPDHERAAAQARLLDLRLGYSEAPGSLELRSLLAATYRDTGPDEILITTGAIEANFLLFNELLEPGDHVVAVHPAYQQIHSVPRAIGADLSLWEVAHGPAGFHFDLDALERLITPRTKLLVVNSPHNPTGAVLAPEQFARIYALADGIGATVLSDEAYRWLDHGQPGAAPPPPPMRDLGPRGISVGTFSKPFGLPGLRIGWIAGPADLIARCWALRDYISLSPGKLNDALAVLAFQQKDQIIARSRRIIAANLATADDWFAANADLATWSPPRAGLLALLRYAPPIPSLDVANRLATEHGVMLAPGSAFGYEGHLRIGVGQEPALFAAGLERTSQWFRQQ